MNDSAVNHTSTTRRAASPVTVAVRDRDRVVDMYVVRPGMPTAIAITRPQVTLEWMDVVGKSSSQKVVEKAPHSRDIVVTETAKY